MVLDVLLLQSVKYLRQVFLQLSCSLTNVNVLNSQVQLMNVNDEKPQIDRTNLPTISLTENQDNATVLKLSALDKDGLGQLTFSFGGTIDQETFPFYFSPSESNDSCTSVFLSVKGSRLDYERQTFWQLQIVAISLANRPKIVQNWPPFFA